MDNQNDNAFELINRVYDSQACAPTVTTIGGGDRQPKVIKEVRVIGGTGYMWGDKQYRQQHRVVDKRQVAYAVNAEAVVNSVVKDLKHE